MPDDSEDLLERAVAQVYRGPLEEFVQRRDALAKDLRAGGNREAASLVKALKKPSRVAWALNLCASESRESIEAVVAAVGKTVDARVAGGDVRAAIVGLRAAVHELAGQAARAAENAGQRTEPAVLASALFAVLGQSESFDQLRRGHLADIPEGGGLDLLTNLPAAPVQGSRPAATKAPQAPSTPAPPTQSALSPKRAALETAARQQAQKAASALAAARERSAAAEEALQGAESKLRAAELRLQKAEEEARALRTQRDRARRDADAAAAQVNEAENAAAEAELRLEGTLGEGVP